MANPAPIQPSLLDDAVAKFRAHYGTDPTAAAYAPGRAEILGNHTDYNEGFVLSVAINRGTYFLAAPEAGELCRVVAGDLMEEGRFPLSNPNPDNEKQWLNYVMGVSAQLAALGHLGRSYKALFFSNVPLGSGLSSSAALEISSGLALSAFGGFSIPPIEMARIAQRSEHEYVGAKTGLLDQISSLYGKPNHLVLSDFRSLEVQSVPLSRDVCFLVCDTKTKHSLVDSEYNHRRAACEEAAAFFAERLGHPVHALRDVTREEHSRLSEDMDPVVARRAAHVIGENERVLAGKGYLDAGETASFGRLMYESHESSRLNFENSCPELDALVSAARGIPSVLGARLSGGGFGGSMIAMLHPADVEPAVDQMAREYKAAVGGSFEPRVIEASAGATVQPI